MPNATKKPEKPMKTTTKQINVTDTSGITGMLAGLKKIAEDDTAQPQARTAAARAWLEAKGMLGRHQQAPGTGTADLSLSQATRGELEAELAALRLQYAAHAKGKDTTIPRA